MIRVKLEPGAFVPVRAHPTDGGLDIRAIKDSIVRAHGSAILHTGVHIEMPHETIGDVRPKSGLMMHHDLLTFGTVDEGYSGEVMVKMFNLGDTDYNIRRGDKITQIVISTVRYDDVEVVDEINQGERGADGFGSTGR